MNKVITLCIASLLWAASASAAEVEVNAGYLTEGILHSGGRLGAGLKLLGNERHALLVRADLGVYVHPQSYVGAWLSAELEYRLSSQLGPFLGVGVGVGYLHSFLASPAYTAGTDGGDPVRTSDAGTPHFTPVGSLELGWNLKKVAPISLFVRPGFFFEYPRNTRWLFHPTAELGLRWSL